MSALAALVASGWNTGDDLSTYRFQYKEELMRFVVEPVAEHDYLVRADSGGETVQVEFYLDPDLLELLRIRASQLNGCAYCLDMHGRDARDLGENQRRLDVVAAWRGAAGLFTERERAALAFTEAVTRIADAGVPDPVWAELTRCFDDSEVVRLLLAVATINVEQAGGQHASGSPGCRAAPDAMSTLGGMA